MPDPTTDPVLEKCLAAFAARDYRDCYHLASESGESPHRAVLNQLLAICLQRLRQAQTLDRLPQLMADEAGSKWEKTLVRITFGQVDLEAALRSALTPLQQCQARYYGGARLLTLEQRQAALAQFDACLATEADCVERLLAQIERAALASPEADERVREQQFDLLNRRSRSLMQSGRHDLAIQLAQEACELAGRHWGQDDRRFASALCTLVGALAFGGHVEDAVALTEPARSLAERHFGADHPDFAETLNALGFAHKHAGRLDEATQFYQAAAAIWERSPDGHQLECAAVLNNLGQVLAAGGKLDEAEANFRRALDRLDPVTDEQGLFGTCLNNLGLLYGEKNDPPSAERAFQRAVEYFRERVGEDHPLFATSINNLGKLYQEQGRFAEAEPLLLRALEICKATAGPRHEHTLKAASNLLELYQKAGDQQAFDRLVAQLRTSARPSGPCLLRGLPELTPYFRPMLSQQGALSGIDDLTAAVVAHGQGAASAAYQELLRRCADDFVEGQHGSCGRTALMLLAGDATHEAFQMLLIDLQRQPPGPADGMSTLMTSMTQVVADPWCRALLALTTGQADERQVWGLAQDDRQRCEALYYAGQRRLTAGDAAAARERFDACLSIQVNCFERRMAQLVSDAAAPTVDPAGAEVGRLNQQVGDLLAQGRHSEALPLAAQAWERARDALPEGAPERLTSQYNLAGLTYLAGDLAGAEALYEGLLARLRQSPAGPMLTGACLNGLGLLYTDVGRFDRAEPLLLEALRTLEQAGKKGHADYAQTQGNLAELYREMGDLVAAIDHYHQALEVKRATQGRDHPDYANVLKNLGIAYLELGDKESAGRALEDAAAIYARLPEGHPRQASIATALGALYLQQGRLDEAEALFRKALRVWGPGPNRADVRYATTLNNLGGVHLQQGKLAEAEQAWRQSRAILETALGARHPNVACLNGNLTLLCSAAGRHQEALALAKEVQASTDELLAVLFGTASERQRVIATQGKHLQLSGYLSALAEAGAPAGEVPAAFDLVLRRKGISAEAQAVQSDEIASGRHPRLRPAVERVRSLREKIARKALAGAGLEGPQAHQQRLAEWDAEKERLEAELARELPEVRLAGRLRRADRRAVASALPEGSALVEFVRFLHFHYEDGEPRPHGRYWAFVLGGADPEGVRLIDLGEAEPIDRLVAAFRSELTGRAEAGPGRDLSTPERSTGGRGDAGGRLRAAVFDRLLPALGSRARLFLCPDGDLTRLPFGVLPDDDGRPLIDRYSFSYLNSGRDALRFGATPGGAPSASLVLADPDFDLAERQGRPVDPAAPGRRWRGLDRSGITFVQLPATRREGERVGALLGVTPWRGADVLEGRLKKACRSPRVLHLATHGFFLEDQNSDSGGVGELGEGGRLLGRLPQNPLLRSGLALAGANTWLKHGPLPEEAEDGLLTAEDVTGLDLSGTELVVLSACETGLGEVRTGDGVFGLQRAFILAGARTLVMSLWTVPDEATRLLIEDFYDRILRGQPKAEALRQAQQALRARPAYSNPVNWGAFVCLGDPGPLSPGSSGGVLG